MSDTEHRPWVETGIQIHDHFDGAANCVQCCGPCKLRGETRLATELTRWMFERWVRYGPAPSGIELEALAQYGVRIEECYNRAAAASED